MSNSVVGTVYERIIESVIEASRTDFEEYGTSNQGLQMLKDKWQQHLSNTQRAAFPWDPAPPPPPAEPPTVPSNATKQEATPAPSTDAGTPASSEPVQQSNNAPIKQEPYDTSFLTLPQSAQSAGAQRAQQILHERFGMQAQGSINAIQQHGGTAPVGTQSRQNSQSSVPLQAHGADATVEQAPTQQAPASPPVKQEPQSNLTYSQVDGVADVDAQWHAIVAERGATGIPVMLQADSTLREQLEESGRRLEAGGLLVPLDERQSHIGNKRKMKSRATNSGGDARSSDAPLAQVDGPDDLSPRDEDVADEDAINSDLDDSDEELDTGIETAYDGDVILCLYDKVQRVKNKWKCTLKDGVVTVGGRDYVFHKAQGEFEW